MSKEKASVKLWIVGSIGIDDIKTRTADRKNLLGGSVPYSTVAASFFTKTGAVGVVGDDLSTDELKVSICAKDSRGPYNRALTGALVDAAQKHRLDFAVDIYPYYGSDTDAALTAGHDYRHALIGPGVSASHGYERVHEAGLWNTFALLFHYLRGL